MTRILNTLSLAGWGLWLLAGCAPVSLVPAGGDVGPTGAGSSPPGGGPAWAEGGPVAGGAEVRGVWVIRTTLTDEASARAMVREAYESGINTLFVQVRGRADAFYPSRVEPRSHLMAGAPDHADPLAAVVEEAHALGMGVHAWIVTHLVWGRAPLPDDPEHLVRAHPEWLAVPEPLAPRLFSMDPRDPAYVERLHAWSSDPERHVEGLFTSPSHPEVRRRVVAVVEDLLDRYPLDGIHLDYVRYPSPLFDYSRSALEGFREEMIRRTPPGLAGSLDARVRRGEVAAWTRMYPEMWARFREEQVTRTVREIRAAVEASGRSAVLTAAVFPDPMDARRGRFQTWTGWLERGLVDAVLPMAYTSRDETFADLVEAARRADAQGQGKRVWVGVGIYQNPLPSALAKIRRAREAGLGGVVLFSFDWARDEAGSVQGEPYLRALGRAAFGVPAPTGVGRDSGRR